MDFMRAMLALRGSNKTTVKDMVELRKYVAEESGVPGPSAKVGGSDRVEHGNTEKRCGKRWKNLIVSRNLIVLSRNRFSGL